MSEHKRSRGFVFEGEALESYKDLRDRWIMLTIISSALPILLTCIISWYCGKLQLIELFGQGEIILSLFSLTVPLMFDLFEIKRKTDIKLTKAFAMCVFLVALQLVFYCLIRIDESEQHIAKGFWTSIPFVFASWFCCIYSIKAISKHSEEKEA